MSPRPFAKRVHVWISGRVQGVYYRGSCEREAVRAGVTGWVRNLEDGRVEAVFEGPADAVDRMVEWCRQGPPAARVQSVDAREEKPSGEFSDFTIAS